MEELEVVAFSPIDNVLGEEHVHDPGQGHVQGHKHHQRVEVARAPVQGEQHEGQQSGHNLQHSLNTVI